jgi:hypothetical protein
VGWSGTRVTAPLCVCGGGGCNAVVRGGWVRARQQAKEWGSKIYLGAGRCGQVRARQQAVELLVRNWAKYSNVVNRLDSGSTLGPIELQLEDATKATHGQRLPACTDTVPTRPRRHSADETAPTQRRRDPPTYNSP